MITVRALQDTELAWANDCYARVQFQPSGIDDFIAVAEVDGVKTGLGRLVRLDEATAELGGIYVLPAFRGRHLARRIVDFLLRESPYRRLYCIPFAHLIDFYRGFGFEPVAADAEIPCAVAEKLNWCSAQYRASVGLLLRVAS